MILNLKTPHACVSENVKMMFDAGHILIGGTTGSGKSVLIDNYIYNLIGRYFPSEKQKDGIHFVLIDPKRVSLVKYKRLPHVIAYETENNGIIATLKGIVTLMDNRYKEMSEKGLSIYDGGYIVIIIDELADLMVTCKKQIMPLLQRIAQLGRASKIKLVCATQSPNRKVIPAELVVNFTGRVALRCLSAIESRQIINRTGAELLPRYGQAIYLHADGYYHDMFIEMISDEEIKARVNHWINQMPDGYTDNLTRVKASKKGFWKRLFG